MRIPRPLIAVLLATGSISLTHAANVVVTYGDPDRFTDARDRSSDPARIMKELEQFLKKMGDRYLPAHATLTIEILDLDRAGRARMPDDIRVMNGKADFPCMDLRHTLELDGKAGQPRRERVCDLDYLTSIGNRADNGDPLVYEKRMLEAWFQERFARIKPKR